MSGAASRRAAIAVFASGGGRSLENLVLEQRAGRLPGDVRLVLASTAKAYALERAKRFEIPAVVLDPERRLTPTEYSRDAFAAVDGIGADLVVLAGFLRLLAIPERWLGRVLNIHPSLLPAFGGQGFFGERVHAAVLARGCTVSGCTVHYVSNAYDAGPILLQRTCPVHDDDTPETLAARVFEQEKLALPEAIRLHVDGHPRALRAVARLRAGS